MWPLILFFNKVAPRWPQGLPVVWGSWALNSSLLDTSSPLPLSASTSTFTLFLFLYGGPQVCYRDEAPPWSLLAKPVPLPHWSTFRPLSLTAIVQRLMWRNSLSYEQRHAISATAVGSLCGYRFWETWGQMTWGSGSRGYKTWCNACLFGNIITILQSKLEVKQSVEIKRAAVLAFFLFVLFSFVLFCFVVCKA